MRQFRAPKTVPLAYHEHHKVQVRTTDKHNGAYYWCLDCNKWISWLSKKEVDAATELKLLIRPPSGSKRGKWV